MTKHTPGPWAYDGNVIGSVKSSLGLVAITYGPGGTDEDDDDRTLDHGSMKPNARLIAAAPTMLAALKELAAIEPSANTSGRVREIARAAIESAEPTRAG